MSGGTLGARSCVSSNDDRGLYASWNEGLAATSVSRVCISTAGETITRGQVLLMLRKGKATQADVVISPNDYGGASGRPTPEARKRPNIYAQFAAQGDVLIAHRPCGILLSSQPERMRCSEARRATCSAETSCAPGRSPKTTARTAIRHDCFAMRTR